MWRRTGKEVIKDETVSETIITYRDEERENPYKIESRKAAIPHANGEGYWYKTYYWVVGPDGEDLRMLYTLKEAKECAEATYSFRGRPYENCSGCKFSGRTGGLCKVYDRFQRLPRDEGGLGMCIKIGGSGC